MILITSSFTECGPGPADADKNVEPAGAWVEQSPESEMIHKAYELMKMEIAKEHPEIVPGVVEKVWTQPVSGINYRFICEYKNTKTNKSGKFEAVIYKNLEGNISLTRFDPDLR